MSVGSGHPRFLSQQNFETNRLFDKVCSNIGLEPHVWVKHWSHLSTWHESFTWCLHGAWNVNLHQDLAWNKFHVEFFCSSLHHMWNCFHKLFVKFLFGMNTCSCGRRQWGITLLLVQHWGRTRTFWTFGVECQGVIAWSDTQNIWRSSKVSVSLVMFTSSSSSSWLCFALKNPPQWWWSLSSWFCFGLKNPPFDGDGILFVGSILIYRSHHDGSLHFGYVLVLKNPSSW